MNRKKFIQAGGRIIILGGLGVLSGYLLLNKKVSATCSVSPTCENCGKFAKCELPQAKEVKNGEEE